MVLCGSEGKKKEVVVNTQRARIFCDNISRRFLFGWKPKICPELELTTVASGEGWTPF